MGFMSMDDIYNSKFNNQVGKIIYQNANGGGRKMESRVAKLESDVGYIKTDIIDLKKDVKILKSDTNDIKTNIAIMIHRIDGIINSIAKLPTEDKINTKFSEINARIDKTNNRIEIESVRIEDKINTKFSEINSAIVKTNNKIGVESAKLEEKLNVKFFEINKEIVKTNCKIEVESAKLESKINSTRIYIISWVLGLPSLLYSVYRGYLFYLTGQ